MSALLFDTSDGIVTLHLAGKLSPDELATTHALTGGHLREWGGGCLLILAEQFDGWTREGNWEDLPFQTANDELIRKMAIVGDPRWKDLAEIFTAKRMRPFPLEYFPSGHADEARAWLQA